MARRPTKAALAKLRSALGELVGLQLTIWRRAASMLNIQFGPIQVIDRGSIGRYGLHIDCPWRLTRKGALITGSGDLFRPASPVKEFDWKSWYAEKEWRDNLMESLVRGVLKGYDSRTRSIINATRGFVVRGIELSPSGDVRIAFSGGYALEVFINGSAGEFYRLLDHESGEHHVLSGE